MDLLKGFPPLLGPAARCLILGSMPGQASLDAGRYYAHPRNAFWPIMGELLGFDPQAPYPQRCQALQAGGIALWDVIARCRRPGSLDADIERDSIEVNEFASLLAVNPGIGAIFFNGAAAEIAFRRHVLPGLGRPDFRLHRLPSTSPAHAALSLDDKRAAWGAALGLAKRSDSV